MASNVLNRSCSNANSSSYQKVRRLKVVFFVVIEGNGFLFFYFVPPFNLILRRRERERKLKVRDILKKLRLAYYFVYCSLVSAEWLDLKCTLMLCCFVLFWCYCGLYYLAVSAMVMMVVVVLCDWRGVRDQKTHFHSLFCCCCSCCILPKKIFPLTSNAKRMRY